MPYTLEVCVDSTASALAAKRGGADRLELCADLVIGGTTPSLALLRQVKAETGLPVRALLRPRFGDFCYDRYELAQMEQSAAELVEAGADGIVTGVLTPDGVLDVDALRPIYAAARRAAAAAGRPVACTLHRAFDVCRDPFAALAAARNWALPPSLPAGRPPVRRRELSCCASWWKPPRTMWKFWWVPASPRAISRRWPPRPVPGRSTSPASRCWTAA